MTERNPYHRAMITYHVPLRLDLMAQLTLPVQLTEQDGDRLCALIRSLQFPTAETVALEAEAAGAERGAEGDPSRDLQAVAEEK